MRKRDLQFEEFVSDAVATAELDYVEVPIATRVFLLVAAAALVIMLVAVGRVVYLNVGRGQFYQARAQANVNQEKPLPAYRGIITDRYGEVLAKNTETFSIFLNISELLKDRQQFDSVLAQLSDTLNLPVADLEAIASQTDFENKSEVPVVRNITTEQAIAVRGLALPPIQVENDFRREYPQGSAFSTVLGYTGLSTTGATVVGKAGLEHYYDDALRGTDGMYVYTRDVKGNVLSERTALEPVQGQKLTTTLDGELQQYFYDRLKEGLTKLGIKGGVGIALDPTTGEILSLVSLPTYDNNIFVTPSSSAQRLALIKDQSLPLFNRAINGGYNPGSTIKPLVALAALHENIVSPTYQIFSPGYIELPNPYMPDKPTRFLDWRPQGWVDIHSALARSSNVYFYEVGGGFEGLVGLGINRLNEYWQKFGLGVKTGIDADSENIGFLPTVQEKVDRTHQPWRIGDTYNVAIGQGDLLVSPLQLIDYIGSIANNGLMNRPHLVHQIGTSEPVAPQVLIDYSSWQRELHEVQLGMHDGVIKDYGTSYMLHDLPMTAAAKTGSAQIQNNTKTNAFFVGYAPFEKPQIAISILVENAKEGSLNAVPIAYDVLNWYYQHRISTTQKPSQ